MRRLLLVIVAVLAVAPASALAANRYASPLGSGTACTAMAPCSIVQAVNFAASGDVVMLAGNAGTYGTSSLPLTAELFPPQIDITVEGAPGQPRPVIYSNAQNMSGSTDTIVLSEGDILRGVDIEAHGNFAPVYAPTATGTILVDHVIAHALDSSQPACTLYGAVLLDSVCWATSGDGVIENLMFGAAVGALPVTLRNSTVIGGPFGEGLAAYPNTSVSLSITVTNSIIRGGGGLLSDIQTNTSSGGSVSVVLEHSNYATAETSGGGSVTPAGTGTNQTADPMFVNPATGDYREAAGSPTINAGVSSADNGATDLDGNLRAIGGATDIGAYEFVTAPQVTLRAASSVGPTGATLNGTLLSGAAQTTYAFEYGPTPSYGHTSSGVVGPAAAARVLSVRISGFSPGKTIHYRLMALNSGGPAATPDATFTTPAPKITGLRISPTSFKVKAGARVSYRDAGPSRTTFNVFRLHKGHRHLVGSFVRSDRTGLNHFHFGGRLHGKKLSPGRFILVARPRLSGRKGPAASVGFKILP
jgi:hypothetical protein